MATFVKYLFPIFLLTFMESCKVIIPTSRAAVTMQQSVLTKEERKKLSPELVLEQLKKGNERFRNNNSTQFNHRAQIQASASGQYPKAIVLSCIDSRVPVEDLLDQGLGDLFVTRVAGNIVNEDILGSMEFACKVAGAKLILVIGHEHCGAIKGAIDDVQLGNLTNLLARLKPAVDMCRDFAGEKKSTNDAYVQQVAENNVRFSINAIRQKSAVLKEMEDKGEIKIVGAYYSLTSGELVYLN